MEGIVWNRRYNIISIKNIIIKVYNIGNITAYCGISRYITVLRGVEGDIVGFKGVSWHHGGFMGIQGDSRDSRVSPGITADL